MKRVLWVLPLVLCFSIGAWAQAQETPEWELSGGYSFLRANISGTGPSFDMNGGYGSITENMNSWFGGRFEFNAWGGTLAGTNISAQTFTYGPVVSLRKFHGWTPYAHAQFGAVHASAGFGGISESDSKFAMTYGGGADIRVGSRAAIRFQADYLYTRFLNTRQNNIQVTTGIVIYLGRK
jgi:opacity protein-like surface antigen